MNGFDPKKVRMTPGSTLTAKDKLGPFGGRMELNLCLFYRKLVFEWSKELN